MDSVDKDIEKQDSRPACFGDEVKFISYVEDQGADSECGRCPRENECGEFILLKCSRELIF
jgi:hypothetical protein